MAAPSPHPAADLRAARSSLPDITERALERSLRPARERAQQRLDRIVAAGYELIGETGGTDFTLQDVAARAGVSLRTLYQCFDGRDELLLAVFARGIETTVPVISREVARHRTPARQLQAFVETSYRLVFDQELPQTRPLTYYHLRLTQTQPESLGAVLAPRNEILIDILRRGVAAGSFRRDIPLQELAVMLSQTLLAMMHTTVLGRGLVPSSMSMANVWKFCLGAVSPIGPLPVSGRTRSPGTRPR